MTSSSTCSSFTQISGDHKQITDQQRHSKKSRLGCRSWDISIQRQYCKKTQSDTLCGNRVKCWENNGVRTTESESGWVFSVTDVIHKTNWWAQAPSQLTQLNKRPHTGADPIQGAEVRDTASKNGIIPFLCLHVLVLDEGLPQSQWLNTVTTALF